MDKTFVGFGFGPIQAALFVLEAYRSKHFGRLVVAEVDEETVRAIRRADGCYCVNVADQRGVESHAIRGLEVYNPQDSCDREKLKSAIADADEVATALPSTEFYRRGELSVAQILAAGLASRLTDRSSKPVIVYAAENNNRAAELLESAVAAHLDGKARAGLSLRAQFLNTVIGKMSGTVEGAQQISEQGLVPLTETLQRACLVEAFNKILITRVSLPGVERGIDVFEEKADLLPFEEAKLYGHNAAHALIGYLARPRGYHFMSEIVGDPIFACARDAFVQESGTALIDRYSGTDPLFAPVGWQEYADNLMRRMTNSHLHDSIDRVTRDPARKLGWNDRLIGTMRLALSAGIQPVRYALGAAAAANGWLPGLSDLELQHALDDLWRESGDPLESRGEIHSHIRIARKELQHWGADSGAR